jgi:hypothetical protein
MSLLMDALKKAELAKRQGQGETAGDASGQDATAGLMLEPMADSSPPASASAENLSPEALASRLEEIDTQFLAEAREAAAARLKAQATAPSPAAIESSTEQAATNRSARTPGAQEARRPQTESAAPQDRSAAQNVFAAKQADKPSGRKNAFAITVGAVTVLAVCGIGGYFWWQLQPKAPLVASRPPPTVMPAPAVTPPAAVPPRRLLRRRPGLQPRHRRPVRRRRPVREFPLPPTRKTMTSRRPPRRPRPPLVVLVRRRSQSLMRTARCA